MTFPKVLGGIVLVLEGEVAPSLRRIAKKRALTIVEVEAAQHALQHVRGAAPRVIALQVGPEGHEALKFIQLYVTEPHRAPLIAVAIEHSTDLERRVLGAGANYYASGAFEGMLDPLVEAVLSSEPLK